MLEKYGVSQQFQASQLDPRDYQIRTLTSEVARLTAELDALREQIALMALAAYCKE